MQPAFYIPHGGGPCFFMDDPQGTWSGMAAFLRGIAASLPETPSAILIVSGHWETAGFAASTDGSRGYDHGVFVPLKVAFPDARVPVIELSLDRGLDAALHLAMGEALAPLREQNVLVIGAGMSVHNLRAWGDPRITRPAMEFDEWLNEAVSAPAATRAAALSRWHEAPNARICHPRHEHLLPLMVAAGSSPNPGQRVFHEMVLGAPIAGFRFD